MSEACAVGTEKGYLVKRVADAPTVPCSCGASTRLLTRRETPVCNLHVTQIADSKKHYHKQCTEVYFILEGHGRMELGQDVIEVEPEMVIYIEPGTPHRLTGQVRTVVFGLPAIAEQDEYLDC